MVAVIEKIHFLYPCCLQAYSHPFKSHTCPRPGGLKGGIRKPGRRFLPGDPCRSAYLLFRLLFGLIRQILSRLSQARSPEKHPNCGFPCGTGPVLHGSPERPDGRQEGLAALNYAQALHSPGRPEMETDYLLQRKLQSGRFTALVHRDYPQETTPPEPALSAAVPPRPVLPRPVLPKPAASEAAQQDPEVFPPRAEQEDIRGL